MKDDNYEEHPLDKLLDDESEEDFGYPEIRSRFDHFADEDTSGNLGDWSAEDFGNMYVRFRPHLERHARRYLSDWVQAEEVVQDAFLYLMTSLPELDSELGVLKFLKWKVRLLCLDVHRSASSRYETAVPEHAEYASEGKEITADLERAEDAAIIRLALAKLNPRQREVLVASVYEEKSTDEIAERLELSPNATRQLLFRARSAFRKALIGEAEVQGKSIGQVLSIAAKKAALDARENAMKVGVMAALIAVGVGSISNFAPDSAGIATAEAPIENIAEAQEEVAAAAAKPKPLESLDVVTPETASEQVSEESEFPDDDNTIEESNIDETGVALSGQNPEERSAGLLLAESPFYVESEPFDPWEIDPIFEQRHASTELIRRANTSSSGGAMTLANESGVWADLNFDLDSEEILSDLSIGFMADSQNFFASPEIKDFYVSTDDAYETYVFLGELGSISDVSGQSWSNTGIDGSRFTIELVTNLGDNQIMNSSLSLE